MDKFSIRSGSAEATVFLDGGKLGSLKIEGTEVLVDAGAKATRWGSFPMIPWCGRLDQGILNFRDSTHQFEKTADPHANHGFCHTKPWSLVEVNDTLIEMSTELDGQWPYGGSVTQKFKLVDNNLITSATIHGGDQPMPVMIGWHPWFVKELPTGEVASLKVAPSSIYELAPDLIPTGKIIEVPPRPWDNCFIGLANDPSISWGEKIRLTISSDMDHWVIYTQPEHALCVEPQSGPPNQPNSSPRILEPGSSFSAWMKFAW